LQFFITFIIDLMLVFFKTKNTKKKKENQKLKQGAKWT
jgi:hypothetical protein